MRPLSPRSEQRMGFMSLNNGRSDSDRSDTLGEGDIPLAQVHTSSSTGARRQNQRLPDMSPERPMEEKSGLFHRKSKHTNTAAPGGRRKMIKPLAESGRKGTFGEDGGLNAMGRLYHKIIGFSVITRYFFYIAPVALVLAVPLIVIPITGHYDDVRVGGSEKDNAPRLFYLFLWIEISWLCLWAGKIVSHFLPHAFMFLCGVVSVGTRKYATVLKSLEIPFSLFFWALASWLVFRYKFQVNGGDNFEWVYIVARILGSLFVSSCVFLGEKAIIQLISITYHQRSFANRIKDSKRQIYLLGLMFEASRTLFPMYCQEFAEEDYIINDSIEMMLGGKKRRRGHKKSGSVTPLNLIGDAAGGIGRVGGKITSVFGNFATEITGKQVFNPNSSHSVVLEALEKLHTSEALARRIWMSFVVEDKDSLYQDDIVEVLGPQLKEEAEECFEAIDADQNGDISLDEMVRQVVEVGKERKAIGNSMKDIGQALGVLDNMLLFCVFFIVIFIFLSFFNSSFVTTIASAGTALLSLSFAFSVTCQELLGSVIFLFVKHPYDVGDRVDINDETLVVEKISLLYTVFTRLDTMKVVQTPNIIVNNLWIENITRSKAMRETIELNVAFDTSFEDIELLRLEMEKFVRHAENSRDFQQDFAIGVGSVNDCDKLTLQITIKHKSNWHNDVVRATRRSKFICALALACKKIPIRGPGGGGDAAGSPNNPTYSVSVTDEYAIKAREKSAADTDAARMVPLKPKEDAPPQAQQVMEENAVAGLTSRPPMAGLDNNFGYNRDAVEERHGSPSVERSSDRLRADNIDSMRQGLLKRESTRTGRRKAGDGVSAMSISESTRSHPGLTVTQHGDSNITLGRQRSYDIESQTGGMGSHYSGLGVSNASGYGTAPSASPSGAGVASQSYNVYHPQTSYSIPGPSSPPMPHLTPPPLAVTTATPEAEEAHEEPRLSSPVGARRRGASVSQVLEDREREEQARRQQSQGRQ